MHHCYITTRFSIADAGYAAWRQASTPQALYAPERLRAKMAAFTRITVPTVLAQTHRAWRWLVAAGQGLPEVYRAQLRRLCARDRRITLVFVDSMRAYHRTLSGWLARRAPRWLCVRLDDDDGLHPQALAALSRRATQMPVGSVLSFSRFVPVRLDAQHRLWRAKCEQHETRRVTALGCAGVGFDLTRESHWQLSDRRRVEFLAQPPQLLYCGAGTDTGRPFPAQAARELSLATWCGAVAQRTSSICIGVRRRARAASTPP